MKYVAGVASLPADLQRNYGLLGQLDQQYQGDDISGGKMCETNPGL